MSASLNSPTNPRSRALLGYIGVVAVIILTIAAVFAPLIAPNPPQRLVGLPFEPPGKFLLGTDVLGRDLLSRLIYGTRLTLFIAFTATTIGFAAGVAWGFVAAEMRGIVDDLSNSLVDILLSIPPLMVGLLVIAALSSNLAVLIGVIAFIQMPRIVRVARAIAADIASLQFVEAARARGESLPLRLIREILPNAWRQLAVEYGLRTTYSTLFISSLSFLGLGIQPPDADWGGLVRENMTAVQEGTYLPALIPALAIGVFGVAVNLAIDWLGDDPVATIPTELV